MSRYRRRFEVVSWVLYSHLLPPTLSLARVTFLTVHTLTLLNSGHTAQMNVDVQKHPRKQYEKGQTFEAAIGPRSSPSPHLKKCGNICPSVTDRQSEVLNNMQLCSTESHCLKSKFIITLLDSGHLCEYAVLPPFNVRNDMFFSGESLGMRLSRMCTTSDTLIQEILYCTMR